MYETGNIAGVKGVYEIGDTAGDTEGINGVYEIGDTAGDTEGVHLFLIQI